MNDYNDKSEYEYHYNYTSSQRPGPGPQTPPPHRGKNDIGSWIFNVVMLFAFPPLGLILTITQAMGAGLIQKLFAALGRRIHYGRRTASGRPTAKPEQAAQTAPAESEGEPKAERGLDRVDAGSGALNVFGWILLAFGVIAALGSGGAVWTLITGLCVALGGGAMLFASRTRKRKAKAFARCLTISGTEGLVDIAKLAATLGMKASELEKQLTEMIDRGYYGSRAYIDHRRGLLVISPEDMRDVYRREDEAKKSAAAREQEAQQSEYDRIIAAIAQADEDIDDEAMSEKIRRMQTITAAIFQEVEAHPEKKSQIARFMNYYLPTTLKLLNAYARIEEQGVTGENMAKAKADIEGIADTLVDGYEKQLDTLYRAEAVDIASDVSVIERMMKADGLTEDESPFRAAAEGQTKGGH